MAEHLDSGIWRCCDKPDSGKLDPAIVGTWQSMLETCYSDPYRTHPPNINNWHGALKVIVDKAEEGNALPPFARHVAANIGLTYPAVADIGYACATGGCRVYRTDRSRALDGETRTVRVLDQYASGMPMRPVLSIW